MYDNGELKRMENYEKYMTTDFPGTLRLDIEDSKKESFYRTQTPFTGRKSSRRIDTGRSKNSSKRSIEK